MKSTQDRQIPSFEPLEPRSLLSASISAALHGELLEISPAKTSVPVELTLNQTTTSAFSGTLAAPGFHTYYVTGSINNDVITFKVNKTQTGSRVGTFKGSLRGDNELIGTLNFTVGPQAYVGSLHLNGASATFLTTAASTATGNTTVTPPTGTSLNSSTGSNGSLIGTTAGVGTLTGGIIGTTGTTGLTSTTGTMIPVTTIGGSGLTLTTGTTPITSTSTIGSTSDIGGTTIGSTVGTTNSDTPGLGGAGNGVSDTSAGTGTAITDTIGGPGTIITDTTAGAGVSAGASQIGTILLNSGETATPTTTGTAAQKNGSSLFSDTPIVAPI